MQRMLNKLYHWGEGKNLKFNPTKTVAVLFSKKHKSKQKFLKLGGKFIKHETEVKYLGVTLDKRLSWRSLRTIKGEPANHNVSAPMKRVTASSTASPTSFLVKLTGAWRFLKWPKYAPDKSSFSKISVKQKTSRLKLEQTKLSNSLSSTTRDIF